VTPNDRVSTGADHGPLRPGAEGLDDLDAAIFQELQRDGRRTYRAIAHSLGVPEGTVRFRVNRLIGDGIIRITAMIHPQRLGGVLATVLLRVAVTRRASVAAQLSSWPEVMYLSACSGRADLMLQVVVAGLDALYEFVGNRLAQIEGVLEAETLLELEVLKAEYGFARSISRDHRKESA
jgi:Lrp/AsnC family transcriptional regulator, regulator for asnA, asnC and gidA